MLKYVREYKSQCDFKGIDFEVDLQSLYTEVRQCMANLYPEEFGPPTLTQPEISIKDMGKEEFENFKSQNDKAAVAVAEKLLKNVLISLMKFGKALPLQIQYLSVSMETL